MRSWETRSFGQATVNEIESITLYPIPLHELANVKLVPEGAYQVGNDHIQLKNHWKHGTYLYGVTTVASEKTGLITLSQGYDQAWLAFSDGKLLPHYRYNGWANAWEVPAGESKVIIIYWPQLLSFAGFALLLVTGGWLALHLRKTS